MKRLMTMLYILLAAGLGGCASSPPVRYYSLDDGRPAAAGSPDGVGVAVARVTLPELVDRPQMVSRKAEHRMQISENDRWAEPLRRQIPRLLARDLGEALDSGRIFATANEAWEVDVDFRVTVDIHLLEVIPGQRVAIDATWRVEPRNGSAFFGRSLTWIGIDDMAQGNDYAGAVVAARKALRALAGNIAGKIMAWPHMTSIAADAPATGVAKDGDALPVAQ